MEETIELTTDLNHYNIIVDVEYVTDNNCGADYDGNRGVKQTFINDYKITEIYNKKKEIDFIKRIPAKVLQKINDYVYEKL